MSRQDTTFSRNFTLTANGKKLTISKPVVMGIINLSPDSFFDGGKINSIKSLLKEVELKINEGAAIIDTGAASSRPGATEITAEEEIKRLLPSLKAARKSFPGIFISVDTFHSKVALAAAECGADIINDISAGDMDTNMMKTVAKLKLPYIMMHMQGNPRSMQKNPVYKNVVKEVKGCLEVKIK